MPVTLKASADDKGVKLALAGMKGGMDGGKIAAIAVRAMTQEYLPDLFRSNKYGWKAPLRGGMPLYDKGVHLISGFVSTVSGNVGRIFNTFRYANVHDKGKTITAKKAPYLTFKVGGRWARKKSVTIPQRRFMFWHTHAVKLVVHRVNLFIAAARKGRT